MERQAQTIAREQCQRTLEDMRDAYAKAVAKQRFWAARLALADCPSLLGDAALVELQQQAIRLDLLQTARNRKAEEADRVVAMTALSRNFPSDFEEFKSDLPALEVRAEKASRLALKRDIARSAAEKRRTGVTVGMTQADALASSWGRPDRVNKTTTARSTSEQWVYRSGSYLYFVDGVLTTIQH